MPLPLMQQAARRARRFRAYIMLECPYRDKVL